MTRLCEMKYGVFIKYRNLYYKYTLDGEINRSSEEVTRK